MSDDINFLDEALIRLSNQSGVPFSKTISEEPFIQERNKLLPYDFVHKHKMIPVKEESGVIFVAICDPFNLDILEEVHFLLDSPISEILTSEMELDRAIEICYRSADEDTAKFIQDLDVSGNEESLTIDGDDDYDLLSQDSDSSTINLLNMIIAEASHQNASDIHFEPLDAGLAVRYRVDGLLQEKHKLPKDMQSQLITRIKVLARLDIAEHRLPQDGRIKLRLGKRAIDFRVSTIPVACGERIVMRILDQSSVVLGLEKLGMRDETLDALRHFTKQNQGIILVTGPTGSGKTTTLYSALSEICSPEVNIMTVEDPIEFKLPNMAQISVNQKIDLDFAKGLRHILRQDPDIIMIGEIRDLETAEIAIQASLTGHLVFSTLHTNDAPSAITRLVDMGIEPYLLSSSLLAVLAQRLVRRICPHCKVNYDPTEEECKKLGLESAEGRNFYQGEGCENCFFTGYLGRQGIYELMPMTHKTKQQVIRSADASELTKVALTEGMSTLRNEGLHLIEEGITTIEEVLRVTRAMEEEIF